jgi:uncharacterized protein YjbI with pentapeptide repeats
MYNKITDERILDELRANGNLRGEDLRGADIAAVTSDLSNINFDGAHLEGANLENISFYDAILGNAHLEGANLKGASLVEAVIINANFSGANLQNASFENISNFDGAIFNSALCNGILFDESVLSGGDFTDAHFENSHFYSINFQRARLNGAHFLNCFFSNCDFSEADLQGAHFADSKFEGDDIIRAHLENADFSNVTLSNVNFEGSFLEGTNFQNATKDEHTIFNVGNLSEAQLQQLGIQPSLIQKMQNPNPDIQSLIETIRSDKWDPKEEDDVGNNGLMVACGNPILKDVALELIKSKKIDLDAVNQNRGTALMIACSKEQSEVALALIAAGESNLGLVNNIGFTALMFACGKKLTDVALALIATGQSNPGAVSNNGFTALIYACAKEETDVALALIATGESNMFAVDKNGGSAFQYATENNMAKVLDAFPKNIIDIRQTGFDTISQEDIVISDYLKENPYNVVLMINNSYYFTSKEAIKKQISSNVNIKYGCRQAGEQSRHILDTNIIYDTPYFSLSSLFGLQILIKLEDAKKMMDILSGNMFILRKNITLPAIISQQFINGGEGVSADHCQSGKATDTYNVFLASPDCGTSEKVIEPVKEVSEAVEESKDELTGMSNKIIISYKEGKYPISINDGMTVEELNNLLLDDLKSKGIIESDKIFKVRFIFKGKILKDDLPAEIKENPSAFTIQAMVNPVSGGRKTIKKRKNMKRKTMKKGKNRKTMKKRKTMKNKKTMKKKRR